MDYNIRHKNMQKYFQFIFVFILFFSSCKDESPFTPTQTIPVLSTIAVTDINKNTAVCGGNMISDGGLAVTERGICWSTVKDPTTFSNKTIVELGTDIFKSNITGLDLNTNYYVRAYATNSAGTGYGNSVLFTSGSSTFTPRFGGTVTDIDGNIYHTDTIGTQVWLVENLKTRRYRNGDSIPNTIDSTIWNTMGASCAYGNNEKNSITYGRLYNWYAVNDSRGLAPAGWHVPSSAEWKNLYDYLEGYRVAGGKLKEKGTAHWISPNTSATNETGFTALPGGSGRNGSGLGFQGLWWSATSSNSFAICFYMGYDGSYVYNSYGPKDMGSSVRCVKD
jgi:uncharacterized protein (TIGR02145 family)